MTMIKLTDRFGERTMTKERFDKFYGDIELPDHVSVAEVEDDNDHDRSTTV